MVQRDSLFSSKCESTLHQRSGILMGSFYRYSCEWCLCCSYLIITAHFCLVLSFGPGSPVSGSLCPLGWIYPAVGWWWSDSGSAAALWDVYIFDTMCVQSELPERVQTVLSSTSVPWRRGIRYTAIVQLGSVKSGYQNWGMTVMIRVYYMQAGPHICHISFALMAWTEVSSTRKCYISSYMCYIFFNPFREQMLLT